MKCHSITELKQVSYWLFLHICTKTHYLLMAFRVPVTPVQRGKDVLRPELSSPSVLFYNLSPFPGQPVCSYEKKNTLTYCHFLIISSNQKAVFDFSLSCRGSQQHAMLEQIDMTLRDIYTPSCLLIVKLLLSWQDLFNILFSISMNVLLIKALSYLG